MENRIVNPYSVTNGIVKMQLVRKENVNRTWEYKLLPEFVLFDERHLYKILCAKSLTLNRRYPTVNGLPKHLRTGLRKKYETSSTIYLHTIVLGHYPAKGYQCSHEDGNELDARDFNLKFRTTEQNSRNRKSPLNKTGYHFVKQMNSGKFRAKVTVYQNDKYAGFVSIVGLPTAKVAAVHVDAIQMLVGNDLPCAYNFFGKRPNKQIMATCRQALLESKVKLK